MAILEMEQDDGPWALPEDTLLPAMVLSITPFERPFLDRNGQSRTFRKLEWEFQIADGQYAGMKVRGNTQMRLTTAEESGDNLRLVRPWAVALLGVGELPMGYKLDTDELVGLPCQITIEHQKEPRKDGKGFWHNCVVQDVFPPLGSKAGGGWGVGNPPF